MAREEKDAVLVLDFQGLLLNTDRDDLRSGAGFVQTNFCCLKTGELRVRSGFRVVQFDSDD